MTIDLTIRIDSGLIAVIFAGLVVFGLVYNRLYVWLEKQGYDEGYLSLIVAVGVAVVLVALAALDWRMGLLALGAFGCAGTPMIIGSWWRYVSRRARGQQERRNEVL